MDDQADARRRRLRPIAGRHGAADGPVLGASRYFPALDITAAPRLDLSVYGGDERFVAKLDAGLLHTENLNHEPVLVLHMQRDCRPPEVVDKEPELAARLDCLADLEDLGLQELAGEFAYELCEGAKKAP
jgi:hypothetical protein